MLERISGSFRDPSGHVHRAGGSIFRTISPLGVPAYEAARDAGLFDDLVSSDQLVALREVDRAQFGRQACNAAYVLEHATLPYISHPYEWSFSLLRDAALFHLDLHLELLGRGFTLSDASAYNIQFKGPAPIFIDHLSIRPYQPGEYWTGHRQFCEQFLNPLLVRALFGIPHNAWYRGNLEGIPLGDVAKLLRLRHKASWNIIVHVIMHNRLQKTAGSRENIRSVRKRNLPLSAYKAMLAQLRRWIARLKPDRIGATTWADYATTHSYACDEQAHKRQFVGDTVKAVSPRTVIDLGCNTGDYTKVALDSGAQLAIGFDFDQQVLDCAHQRAKAHSLNFLPLFFDARNPPPDQGWLQAERPGHAARTKADLVLALAFEHHLAIAHNIPLDQVIGYITALAPTGVIEFVPKNDPTVQQMLALRDDIFFDYSMDAFEAALSSHAHIERKAPVSRSGRVLYAFDRRMR